MIRRAVLGLLALVALLVLLVAVVAYSLIGTAPGNRWLLARTSALIPGELQVEQWQGNLLGNVTLTGIRYHNNDLTVTLDQLDADLKPLALSRGWLTVEHLALGRLDIQTRSDASNGDDPAPLPDSLAPPIGVRIQHLSLAELTVNQTRMLHGLNGENLAAWRRFQIARLESTLMDDLRVSLSAHGELSAPYSIDGRLQWQQPLPADERSNASKARGELVARGPVTDLQLSHELQAPLTISSQGRWQQTDQQWRMDLKHQWQEQPLPLQDDAQLALGAGSLTTRGPLDRLQLRGQTTLLRSSPGQEPQRLEIALDSELRNQTLVLEALSLRQSKQQLIGQGEITLSPLKWDLALNGTLDPGVLSPHWPGTLSIDGHSKGQLNGQNWQLEPGTLTVTGELRQQPLTVTASSHGNAENLQLDGTLQWGNNNIQASGMVWPRWQLDSQWALNAISQLQPGLRGSLSGAVQVRGATASPLVTGDLTGKGLGLDNLSVTGLRTTFRDLGPGEQTQQLQIDTSGLDVDGQPTLDTLSLSVDGTLNQHQLTLDLEKNEATLQSRAEGALSLTGEPGWEGTLTTTRLEHQHLGQWQQARPSALALSATRQQLESFCLQQQHSQLCVHGSLRDNQQMTLDAQARALPLALLSPLIGPDYNLEGTLEGEANLAGSPTAPRGTLSLQTRDAKLTFNVEDGPAPLALDTLSLTSDMNGEQAQTHLALVTALGEVKADVQHGFNTESTMDGQASFRVERLSAVEMLTADLRDVSGELKGDIRLGGTPKAPVIEGTIALRNGNALVPALGTAVTRIDLSLEGSPQGRLAVNGQALMGAGTLNITGYLDPARWPLALSLQFSGQNLLVADRPDARIWVSPDLKLAGDLEGLDLTGTLVVPKARIHPDQLPEGAITVSDDQVLVHQEGQAGQRVPLGMDVTVTLGDDVHFDGFGLNATLGGTLQILQQPQQPPQLNGELVVREGRYRAYGQNLAISDGQLIFQGPPDNPGLDIRAYRKIPSDAVTVGVQLSGTLQAPEAALYSDPSMEQSQAMSYLLTGRPLESGTQGESNQIAQALALYGLEKGSGVTEKIGEKLGVDEITVGSDWETDDAALMLGKQLSERLYLTYAIGLFDAVSTVMLRYTLTRSLHLEARSSSEANSLDLIWEKQLR